MHYFMFTSSASVDVSRTLIGASYVSSALIGACYILRALIGAIYVSSALIGAGGHGHDL